MSARHIRLGASVGYIARTFSLATDNVYCSPGQLLGYLDNACVALLSISLQLNYGPAPPALGSTPGAAAPANPPGTHTQHTVASWQAGSYGL